MDVNHISDAVRLLEAGQLWELLDKVQRGEWTTAEASAALERYSGARPAILST